MSENKGSAMREITLAFLLGGLIGAGLALLYAPAPGEETRRKVKETAEKIQSRFKEGYEAMAEKTEEGVGTAKEFIGEKMGEVKAIYEAGKDAYHKEREKFVKRAS